MAKKNLNKPVKKTPEKDPKTILANELRSMIPKLDSEGLAFLVEQARVHLYNMQVDELNRETIAASGKEAGASRGRKTKSAGPKTKPTGNFRIEGTESGSSYYLYYRNNEMMFSRDEMTHLVKIVNAPGTDLEIRERLFNWFEHERLDAFAVIPMKDKFDASLKILVGLIKKTFKIRK